MHRLICLSIVAAAAVLAACRATGQEQKVYDPDPTIETNPNDPRSYLKRGNAWLMKQEFDKAIADYTSAIALDSNCIDAVFNRAYAWRMKDEFDRALSDYNQVLMTAPNSVDALNNRGVIWCCKGNYYEAMSDFDRALELEPKNLIVKMNRSRLADAKTLFETLRNRDGLPELEDAYIRFGY